MGVPDPLRRQSGAREWVTLIECIGAAGISIPAFFILPGTAHRSGKHTHTHLLDPLAKFDYSYNGWTKDQIALRWLEHFDAYATPSHPGAWRLLLHDNHGSHETFEFRDFCLPHRIRPLSFPSHSTHLLQPLDVGINSVIDRYYRQELDNWQAANALSTKLKKGDIIPLLESARRRALTVDNIHGAFRATDIVPFDRQVLLDNPRIRDDPSPNYNPHTTRSHPSETDRLVGQALGDELSSFQREEVLGLETKIQGLEAELAVAHNELDAYHNSLNPVQDDRRILSRMHAVTAGDLATARRAKTQKEIDNVNKKTSRRTSCKRPAPRSHPTRSRRQRPLRASHTATASDADDDAELDRPLAEEEEEEEKERSQLPVRTSAKPRCLS